VSAPIEVLAIRRLDGKSTVKAFCDIRCGGVTLKGCKIVQQSGQAAWLAVPSTKTTHGWQNVVEVSKELRERLTAVALEAWEGGQ
jgi:DNA-binding cell septation regulator SpoVG